jgi:hypothetical protein
MEVRYNRNWAIFLFILAALNVVFGGWLLLLGEFHYSLVLGLLFLVIAIQYMRRPHFIVEPNAVIILGLIGPIRRTHPFSDPNGIKVDRSGLYVDDNGKWKRVPVYRWLSNPQDWKALEDRFRTT